MFTGIIQAIGTLANLETRSGDCRLTINTGKLPMTDTALGDSIAVNGVCLTAVHLDKQQFTADVSSETLSRTSLQKIQVGTPVNLELALTPSTRMGGHIVSGHVDGLGVVVDKRQDARSIRFQIQTPNELAKYIAEKGSICINGISLTVNEVNGTIFGINIVPHTLAETTLGTTQSGQLVNLEVDLLARYMERLMLGDQAAKPHTGITDELLRHTGFLT